MTNRQAPYKNPIITTKINEWWGTISQPQNQVGHWRSPVGIIDLYDSWQAHSNISPYSPDWLSPNQFAKCLVAARIADLGNGTWRQLEGWEPKAYEVARARVY